MPRFAWPPVSETAHRAGLDLDPSQSGLSAHDLVMAWLDASRFADAARFLAFALPKREAVWWACRCSRLAPNATATGVDSPEALAQKAAEAWVVDPSDDRRRVCGAAGEAAPGTPSGCASLAAFWSGGSLAPKGLPEVAPADDLTARGVAAAVMVAGVVATPEHAPERYRAFLQVGLAIGDGQDRWETRPTSPTLTTPQTNPPPPARPMSPSRIHDTWE